MLWLLRKVYHNWVASHKIQMHSLLKVQSLVETRCKKSWDQFEKYDSHSLRYVQANIRENKGPSLGKIQIKLPHQRNPYAMKFEDRSHEETERQTAMRPKQGVEPCQRHIQAQRERQSYILFARGGMGTPGCVNKRAGRKIVRG